MKLNVPLTLTAVTSTIILMACGGGGTSTALTTPTTTPTVTTTTINGVAVKGPVKGATVTIKKASDGAVLKTTTTGDGGVYSVAVDYTGDVVVEVNGGTYVDEATGATTALATPLKSVLQANGGTVTGVVTPITTMAYTYAFGSGGTAVSATAFKKYTDNLASQFHLNAEDLASTPVVAGETNAYGKVLAGLSKYMQYESVTLPTLVNTLFTDAQWTQFSGTYSNAYNAANPGTNITYLFSNEGLTIGGTGTGGGTGTCGVNVTGSVTANNMTVPMNLDYCISGIAAGSCTQGNSTLAQSLNGQSGMTGMANLKYTYSTSCAAGALAIKLK